MLFDLISRILKKLSNGVSIVVLDQSNCLMLIWLSKNASDTRRHHPNASIFGCVLHILEHSEAMQASYLPVYELFPSIQMWSITEGSDSSYM